MKYEKCSKIIPKFAATTPKSYSFRVQNNDHEIEESEFIKAKGVMILRLLLNNF